jgi:putative transposase
LLHEQSDGVLGSFRIWKDLRDTGEKCSLNRVARLMRINQLKGIPQKRRWRHKPSGDRPIGVVNVLERDFTATLANTKWAADITYVDTAQGWLYLCVVLDLFSKIVVGWSMAATQDRHLVLQAVLMALWQREDRRPVVLHSDRGCQFTSIEYQRFLKAHNLVASMSATGSYADNAAVEGFFGLLKRERVNRRDYRSRDEARSDIFDYIERFHNPRKRRELDRSHQEQLAFSKPSVLSG